MGISDAERDRVNRMVRERTQKEAAQRGDVSAGSSSSSGCLIVLACFLSLILAVTLGLMGA